MPIPFPVHLQPEPEGGYSVTCPALPGCHSQGETLDEALANIREAIELVLEDMREHNEPVPDGASMLTTTVTVDA
jgi:predicted RNase H-like HicB family nuclease